MIYGKSVATSPKSYDNNLAKITTPIRHSTMTTAMTGIMVAVIAGERFMLRSPGPTQLAFLEALGLGPPVFLDPRYRCVSIIPLRLASKG